jgi:hypothetical protein
MHWDAARRWWPLAAGILLGVLVGVLVSLLGSSSRKAEAKVLISSPAGPAAVRPLLPNLRELATSAVVAGNVKSTLRTPESAEEIRRHLGASVRPDSEVIALSATDANADKARQLAQEAAVVFTGLVEARFGPGKGDVQAAVLDSAHVLSGPDRHFLRNGLIGALVGLLLGAAGMFALAGGTPTADERELKDRERLLEQRLKGVSKWERTLAQRAAALAADERKVVERQQEQEARPVPVPEAAPEPEPEPEPQREPEPEPVVVTQALLEADVGAGDLTLSDLQRLVDAQTAASPEESEQWRTYLFFLREHASTSGSLPAQFDPLVNEVFGPLLDRAKEE